MGRKQLRKKDREPLLLILYICGLNEIQRYPQAFTLRCSIRNIMHEWRIPYFGKTNACAITNESVELVCATTKMTKFVCKILYGVLKIYMKK